MVKMRGPLMSLTARGWLGRYQYMGYGFVLSPYPIGLLGRIKLWERRTAFGTLRPYFVPAWALRPYPGFISKYYSFKGWCYQMRRTWHGIIWSAIRPPISAGTDTLERAQWRDVFRLAVEAWQGLTDLQKKIWNGYNYPVHPSGYNRFIRSYIKQRYPMSALMPVYKQIWLQAEAVRAPGVNPAVYDDLGITGVWQFADGFTRVIHCKLPMVTDMDRTKDASFYLGWCSSAQSKNARWQVEYRVLKEDEDVSGAAEDTLTQTEASSATANGMVLSSFTIPAASIGVDDHCILFRVSRLGGDDLDTLSDVANLVGVCLHYQSDKLGDPV